LIERGVLQVYKMSLDTLTFGGERIWKGSIGVEIHLRL
jgi:hypothetical protein